jgi:hypothetical protein
MVNTKNAVFQTLKSRKKIRSLMQISDFLKKKQLATSTMLLKMPQHELRTSGNTVDSSFVKLSCNWSQTSQREEAQTQIRAPDATTARPSASQKLNATAGFRCSQGGREATKHPSQDASTATADSVLVPRDPDYVREDEDLASKPRAKKKFKSASVSISQEAINAILPSSPTYDN